MKFLEAPLLLVGFPDVMGPFCMWAQPSATRFGVEQRWVYAAAQLPASFPSFLLLATAGTEIMGIKELLAMAWWLSRLCWRTAHRPREGCADWFASMLFQPQGFPGARAHVCGSWQGWARLVLRPRLGWFWWHEELCACGCHLEKYRVGNAGSGCRWSSGGGRLGWCS